MDANVTMLELMVALSLASSRNTSQKGRVEHGQWNSESTFLLRSLPLIFLIVTVVLRLFQFLRTYWFQPRIIRKTMERQGVIGPTPRFVMGNLSDMARMREDETSKDMASVNHNIVNRLLPHYVRWSRLYGKRFIFWWGIEPRMTVSEPELIKEIMSSKYSLCYGKSHLQQRGVCDFIGKGLVMANGQEWAHQRRVVAPAFNPERLKKQLPHMVKFSLQMMNRWKNTVNEGGGFSEVDVSKDLSRLAGDIISGTIFGNNYEKGRSIFHQLTSLQKLSSMAGQYQWIPISRFFLISVNSRIRKLRGEVENALKDIIQGRRDCYPQDKSYGDDLLGLMLSEVYKNQDGVKFTTQQLIDECKTFFFAGHDTTALLLAWTMMLLAAYPSWQEKARNEVVNTCGTEPPDAESFSKLKVVFSDRVTL
eukprot:Gb_21651 [translate_table: standard]